MRHFVRQFSVGLAFTLVACTRCGDYKYFDLSGMQGASIATTGVLENPRVDRMQPIPLEYVFRRADYSMRALIEPGAKMPHVRFDIESRSATKLKLILAPSPKDVSHCISDSDSKIPSGSVLLVWVGGVACESLSNVTLQVVDEIGQAIAEEIVPVRMVSNGRYCEPDVP